MFNKKSKIFLLILASAMLFMAFDSTHAQANKKDEVEMGREAAAELEKQFKVLEDEELNARVNRIGQELAQIANTIDTKATYGTERQQEFEYIFKILDDKDVNALSMPGGFIYINKGLIDYAQSDDELAGVVAHEIAHIAHHHMMALLKEQSRMNNQLAITLLAAILTGAPAADLGNVMMGARFVQIARLNGYSRAAERDADMTALAYLSHSQYNPVGMLTFMERLARDEMNRPRIDWGVYQTHPFPGDRSREIMARLREKDITIDRRAVTQGPTADVKETETEGIFEVWISGKRLFTPANNTQTSEERARAIANKLNELMDDGLRLRDIRQTLDPPVVMAKGQVLIQVTDEDAALQSPKAHQQVAREAYDVLYNILLSQDMQRIY